MFVEVHAGFRGDVLGADDLTVSLKSLELEELGCREELQGKTTTTEAEAKRTRDTSGHVFESFVPPSLPCCVYAETRCLRSTNTA